MSGKEEASPEQIRLSQKTAPLAIFHPEEFFTSGIDQGSRTLAVIEGSPSWSRREMMRADEELARRLQNRGYITDDSPDNEALTVAADIEFVPHAIWRGSPDYKQESLRKRQMEEDEKYARRIQKEEEQRASTPVRGRGLRISNGMMTPPIPPPRPEFQWTTRGSMHHTEGTSNMPASYRSRPHLYGHSPLRDVMPQFRSLVPSDHPLHHYLLQIQRYNDFTPRSIVFPEEFMNIQGISDLPPQLVLILRGDHPADYESLLELGELLQPVSRGANKEQLELLSTYAFNEWEERYTEQCCGICLSEYERDDLLKNLGCQHTFHSTCADQWLSINRICPVCRNEIQ